MSTSVRLIKHQKPTISAILRLALSRSAKSAPSEFRGQADSRVLPPRSNELIDAYIEHLGIDPAAYTHSVPAHLFAQWSFAPLVKAIAGAPYNLKRALNGGCRLEIHEPIPRNEPLHIKSRLVELDDNGRRALLRVEVITGTESCPMALRAEPYLIVPLPSKEKSKRERPTVSSAANRVDRWQLPANAGREFAILTGDINPIHSLYPFARLAGFKSCILHGFSSLARATESIIQQHGNGDPSRLRAIEAKFTKAISLPNDIGLFTTNDGEFFVGHELDGPAYVTGSFELQPRKQ